MPTSAPTNVRRLSIVADENGAFEAIVGDSQVICETIERARRMARNNETVLITGESGTGKELFARGIVQASDRADGPFVTLNCSAVPEALMESELFGHMRGSFTGAHADTPGLFRTADSGTIFLDEIGDLPSSMQAKLLRFLQNRTFRTLGGTREVAVDVRVVCATNKDLGDEVAAGRFREDLYYRLRVMELHVPALRERPTDVPILIDHFLDHCPGGRCKGSGCFPASVIKALLLYDWPGNVRELENLLKQLTLLCVGAGIGPQDLPPYIFDAVAREREILSGFGFHPQSGHSYSELREHVLAAFNRKIIAEAIEHAGGNISAAARILRTPKSNIIRLMKKYAIAKPRRRA